MTYQYLNELKKEEEDQVNLEEASEVFEGYRVNFTALFYPFVFFLRRYATLIVLTFLQDYRDLQILGHIVATGFVTFYILTYRPFEESTRNRMEAYNELTVLIAAYPLLVFTAWVSSKDCQFNVAWLLVAIICINIIVNIVVLICAICKKAKLKI